jgi:hypothetical protein
LRRDLYTCLDINDKSDKGSFGCHLFCKESTEKHWEVWNNAFTKKYVESIYNKRFDKHDINIIKAFKHPIVDTKHKTEKPAKAARLFAIEEQNSGTE